MSEHQHPAAEAHEAHHEGHAHHDHGVGVPATGHEHGAGHDHSHHDPAQFRRKFWLSLILTIPTLVFSEGLQDILGLPGPRFPGASSSRQRSVSRSSSTAASCSSAGAVGELRSKQPGMMTLISLAIVVALGYSLAVTLGLPGMDFWWELATPRHHHAARSLDRDVGGAGRSGCAGRAREAAPGRGRARPRRPRR